jgi:hypothetical protein
MAAYTTTGEEEELRGAQGFLREPSRYSLECFRKRYFQGMDLLLFL